MRRTHGSARFAGALGVERTTGQDVFIARLGGWLIFLFLVPVMITVYGVAMMTAADEQMQRIQTSFFLKGITMAGAALLITQLGLKLEERRAR